MRRKSKSCVAINSIRLGVADKKSGEVRKSHRPADFFAAGKSFPT
jgi:hypothetical protein